MGTRTGDAIGRLIEGRWSQEAFAVRMGMHDGGSYLNKIINGRRLPGEDLLERVTTAAGLSVAEHIGLVALLRDDQRDRRARKHSAVMSAPEVTPPVAPFPARVPLPDVPVPVPSRGLRLVRRGAVAVKLAPEDREWIAQRVAALLREARHVPMTRARARRPPPRRVPRASWPARPEPAGGRRRP